MIIVQLYRLEIYEYKQNNSALLLNIIIIFECFVISSRTHAMHFLVKPPLYYVVLTMNNQKLSEQTLNLYINNNPSSYLISFKILIIALNP